MRDYRNILHEEDACLFTPRKKPVWRRLAAILGTLIFLLTVAAGTLLFVDVSAPDSHPSKNGQRQDSSAMQDAEDIPGQKTYRLALPPAS